MSSLVLNTIVRAREPLAAFSALKRLLGAMQITTVALHMLVTAKFATAVRTGETLADGLFFNLSRFDLRLLWIIVLPFSVESCKK
jgi:hypothetical protein